LLGDRATLRRVLLPAKTAEEPHLALLAALPTHRAVL